MHAGSNKYRISLVYLSLLLKKETVYFYNGKIIKKIWWKISNFYDLLGFLFMEYKLMQQQRTQTFDR